MNRLVIVAMPVVATFATFVASSDWFVWMLPVVLAAALVCAFRRESNAGLAVIVILALHWVAAVEDPTDPWLLVVAMSIAVFHTAMAAEGVAPPGAPWSPAMRARWLGRLAIVLVLTVVARAVEVVVEGADLEGSALVLAAALTVLTIAALTLRARALRSSWR